METLATDAGIVAPTSRAPLRVLMVTDHIGGGTGGHILSLLQAFDPAVVSVDVISEGTIFMGGSVAQRVRRIPPLPFLHRFPFGQAHFVRALMRELRHKPVDVLHTYGLWPHLYGRLLKRLGLVRCVVENRESDGHTWSPRFYPLLRASGHIPDRVVCVSHSVASHVTADEGIRGEALVVIENGSADIARNTRADARRLLGLPLDAFVVGSVVSQLDRPIKGIRYLVDAALEISRKVPGALVVIIGDTTNSAIAAAVREGASSQCVVLPGYRDDVGDLYPAMDVFALPSLSEGLPVAPIEAMCLGIPVVATKVGGTPEVVLDGVTGYLVEPADARALANRIIALGLDERLRVEMGRAGRRHFEETFDIARTAGRYEQLYATVVREALARG